MAAAGLLGWMLTAELQRAGLGLPSAHAAPPATATASASADPDAPQVPLPELPKLADIAHPPPTPTSVKEIEGRLSQLRETPSSGPLDPNVDLGFVTADLSPQVVPAIAQRIQELRARLEGGTAERLLEKARKAGKRALRKAKRARKGSEKSKSAKKEDSEGDWLEFVLALQKHDSESWQDLTELYGMLRMLEAVGTTPAVRELVSCYSYFGELVRIDLQRAVERLGERAVPALIEARKHDARRVRRWARRQLDGLGRAIPGEAVSTADPQVLADVLRAFGRTRDIDAVRVVLSFCNSDRIGLRDAAREAIVAIGEPATWQIKDVYETLTGKKAPRSWSWQRACQELFLVHDKARLAVVYEEMAEGLSALKDKRYQDAVTSFDRVLARSPLFERRVEMAPAYAARAAELAQEGEREAAMELLRKALRIAPDSADGAEVESRLATLEAEELIEAGTPDRFLLRRALELDPHNERARELLNSLEEASAKRQRRSKRYLAAVIVGLLATGAMILLARRRPGRSRSTSKSKASPPREDHDAGPDAPPQPGGAEIDDASPAAAEDDDTPTPAAADDDDAPTPALDVTTRTPDDASG